MSATELAPEIAELIEQIGDLLISELNTETLEQMRATTLPMELSDEVERVEHSIRNTPHLKVRVHKKKGSQRTDRPCVYSIHGGGYVGGSTGLDDGLFDLLCQKTDCVGVSVEYRLAPESPYPAAIEDCYDGLAWVFANAEALGINPTRVGIHGVSAGGGLAAALALLVRDRGEYRLAYQALDCPMLDDRQITSSSQADNLVTWSRGSNTFGWKSYLGDLYGSDSIPYTAAPSRAEDLSGLPPAFIGVGGADGFRDENIAYALKLGECGTPCELHVYPGAPHAAVLFPTVDICARYIRDKQHWMMVMIETASV